MQIYYGVSSTLYFVVFIDLGLYKNLYLLPNRYPTSGDIGLPGPPGMDGEPGESGIRGDDAESLITRQVSFELNCILALG